MMTEEHIKEAISIRFIELVAAFNGYKTNSTYPDYGTDLNIIEVGYRTENGHKRYSDTGRELKFQFKATTINSIIEDNDKIIYDLDAKAYNDLIERKKTLFPLILILFILPSDKKIEWICMSDNELITKKCAYWYIPNNSDILTTNQAKKRISINKNNLFKIDTLNQLFEKF